MMKPNFALILSFDGIKLLYRAAPGWQEVGEVPLDAADLPGELRSLRDRAAPLDPGGVACKVVIPDDQIRYLSVRAQPQDDPVQTARSALDGATPYAVDDLVFDTRHSGETLQIAAIARETLTEAESFAEEHGFAPLCFVAMPDAADFDGEPWFGASEGASRSLPGATRPERDERAITITGPLSAPADQAAEAPQVNEKAEERRPASDAAARTDEPAPVVAPAPEPPTPEAPNVAPAPPEDHGTVQARDADDGNHPLPEPKPEPDDAPAASAPEASPTKPAEPASETPPPPAAPSDKQPAEAPIAFASIRARRDGDLPEGSPRLDSPARLKTLDVPAKAPAATQRKAKAGKPKAGKAKPDKAPAGKKGAVVVEPLPEHVARTSASLRPDPAERLQRDPEPDPAATPAPSSGKAWSFLSRRKRAEASDTGAAPLSRRAKAQQEAKSRREAERRRMTVFGARHEPVGGKPRFLGLILMALLVLFLVSVAAWASIFLDDGLARLFGTPDDIRITEIESRPETETDPAPEPALLPAPDSFAQTDGPPDDLAEELALLAPEPQEGTAPDTLSQDNMSEPDGADEAIGDPSQAPAPQDDLTSYAVSGIWQTAPQPPAAPSGPADTDDVRAAVTDASVNIGELSTLPGRTASRSDTRPRTPADPLAADTTFVLDARGMVKAAPDGALTPEGVPVFAGDPPATPPASAYRGEVATPDETGQAAPPAESVALIRPEPRPDLDTGEATTDDAAALQDATEEETASGDDTAQVAEDTNASGATIAFADTPATSVLRPRARPQALIPDTPEPPEVDGDAVAAAVADANEQAVQQGTFENPTSQAVSASLMPRQRPAQFAAIVQEARTERAQDPVATEQILSPSLPSSASVSRSATETNAINLRKMNLIGVYGAPDSRRALVRLSNGRYKKVKVGDRLDGGQVAAIGDTELRYVKRGKAVVLRMPKG